MVSVHKVSFDSFFGNFLLNPGMSNFNVFCSCDGFDLAGNVLFSCQLCRQSG
jgi:hypothetical protein